jgi:hypothetical protein
MKSILTAMSIFAMTAVSAQQHIDLSGTWTLQDGTAVSLPGSLLTNHLGDDVTVDTHWTGSLYDSSYYYNPYMAKFRAQENLKFPFFLTPEKHFVGEVQYHRTVFVGKEHKGERVLLFLERPHIETTLYVNGQLAGRDSSLSVPHCFDITPYIIYNRENELTLKVYNGIENVCVGQDSHSVTDQTQGNWNGVVGRLELQFRPQTYITNVQVYPNLSTHSLRVQVEQNTPGKKAPRFLLDGREVAPTEGDTKGGEYRIPTPEDISLWSEFTPNLHTLTTIVGKDSVRTTFGMREIRVEGRQILCNDQPIWLRGTVENCNFPLTGFPPTDEDSWTELFQKCKSYGINHMRFHSYCPPEAAFAAADKVGIYLQPEGPSWPNHGVKLKSGMTIDRYLMEETQRMVRAYGNHPSFCMLAAGNEPAGNWVKWCHEFVDYWHNTGDNRRIYCAASVGGGWAWDANSDYHVKGGARGLNWDRRAPQSNDDYYDQLLRPRNFTTEGAPASALALDTLPDGRTETVCNAPIIAHEQGQWCAFPDLKERSLYTGVYKAANFDIFEDLLQHNHMGDLADAFLASSSRLQNLAYKYEIERNLRTRDYSGFQLLGLNDYSGQGTALVGPLNVFWKEKSYSTPADQAVLKHACAPVVPLAKLPKMVFTTADTLTVPVELYNASGSTLQATPSYTLTCTSASGEETTVSGELGSSTYCIDVLYQGKHRNEATCGKVECSTENPSGCETPQNDLVYKQPARTLPVGKNIDLGTLRVPLDIYKEVDATGMPLKIRLQVQVADYTNEWDIHLYPQQLEMPKIAGNKQKEKNIYVSDTLDAEALRTLKRGGKVLLTAAGKVTYGSDVKQTYMPIFWNTSWFKMRAPHTTGSYIRKEHPLFAHFCTDDWQDTQWWELVNKAQVMNLAEFPEGYQSPFQPIDTWHVSRKLGMIVEANVLGGKLFMTTFDITNRLDQRIVARQLRASILEYMQSDAFVPEITLPVETLQHLYTEQADPVNMFTKDAPDELKPKIVR